MLFQEKGWNVIATVRANPEEDTELNALDNVLVPALDVTKLETIEAAVAAGIDRFGAIDVLLNNAGYGAYGILEATPERKIRMQFDVNVIGPLLCTKAVLPHMRSRGEGTIINISSMGGKITFPLGTLYHGSKFAVEGMSEALSFELAAIGVKVKLIEPGMINTNFADTVGSMFDVDQSQTEYGPFVERVTAGMQAAGSRHSDPIVVAEAIWQAATDGSWKLRYVVGADAKSLLAVRAMIPNSAYQAIVRSQVFG